jgi:hypothetical protein
MHFTPNNAKCHCYSGTSYSNLFIWIRGILITTAAHASQLILVQFQLLHLVAVLFIEENPLVDLFDSLHKYSQDTTLQRPWSIRKGFPNSSRQPLISNVQLMRHHPAMIISLPTRPHTLENTLTQNLHKFTQEHEEHTRLV